jgi:hypothetical protein
MYMTRFNVKGTRHFPIDMLRYDRCFPFSQDDANNLDDHTDPDPRRIGLAYFHSQQNNRPSGARWKSFGWIVEDDILTHKV